MKRLFCLAIGWLVAANAHCHDARPVYVQIQETDPGVFSVQWNAPSSMPPRALPTPALPSACKATDDPVVRQTPAAYVAAQRYRCAEGLSGKPLGIRFPSINPSLTTLFQVRLMNGEQHFQVLKPGDYEWTVPDAETPFAVVKQYTWLGMEHIWIGIDHLLFVACLLFVARTPRRVLITITGFTVAHSLTLALSALQLVRVPVPPVEAVIALSVVFLAVEIARGEASSLTFRYPIAVSSSFGLLHGFGFASVLRAMELPTRDVAWSLLSFNVGVELGQLAIVVVAAWLLAALRGWSEAAGRRLAVAGSIVVILAGTFWFVERVFFPGGML